MHFLEITARALIMLAGYGAALGIALWTAGAIYFDVGRGRWFAWPLTLLWIVGVGAAFLSWGPLWWPFVALLACFAAFLGWWRSQQPSNDRAWNPNFAVLPSFEINGNAVTAYNVRNTEYRTENDFTPHYETRNYDLSNLKGVDSVITYWGSPWLCHPFLSFDFGEDGRLAISIEVRYRIGQKYGFLPSLYRQQEIIYVVSDERDSILKRSKYSSPQEVYLYHLQADSEEILRCFFEYVVSTNALIEKPLWYNGLTNNCTTSIYRQRTHESQWDWRWLFNGRLDEMIYDHGRLESQLPFAELKRQSKVNEIANQAPVEGFGDYIRNALPTFS
jgi:hypothetical protein